MKEQCEFFDVSEEILKSETRIRDAASAIGVNADKNWKGAERAVYEIVKLARHLADISKESEPDVVNKHARSAEALMTYSREKEQDIEASMSDLDRLIRPILGDVVRFDYPTRIGYHNIVSIIFRVSNICCIF